jgi:hypothetical protein
MNGAQPATSWHFLDHGPAPRVVRGRVGRHAAPATLEGAMSMRERRHGSASGELIFGGVLILIGLYFFGQQVLGLDLPDLNWSQIWPGILILVGGAILYGAWNRRSER